MTNAATTNHEAIETRNLLAISAKPDGDRIHLTVALTGLTFNKLMTPQAWGVWWHMFQTMCEMGPAAVRTKQIDGRLVALGHATEDRWFDPHTGAMASARTRAPLVLAAHRSSWRRSLTSTTTGGGTDNAHSTRMPLALSGRTTTSSSTPGGIWAGTPADPRSEAC